MPRARGDGAAGARREFMAPTRCQIPARTPMPVESMKFTPGEVHDQPAMVFISDDPQEAVSEQTAGGHVELTGHRHHGDAAVQAVFQEQPGNLGRAHK